MNNTVLVGFLVAIGVAACIDSDVTTCADGRLCPANTVCDDVHQACVFPDQLSVCVGRDDTEECDIAGQTVGICRDEVCLRSICGDGFAVGSEQCDLAVPGELDDCTEHGYYDVGTVVCSAQCTFDTSACRGACGDGELNGDEVCDWNGTVAPADDVLGDSDCTDLGFYAPAGLACTAICTFDTMACGEFCGDGVINGDEDCDDNGTVDPGDDIFDGADCTSLGYYSADGLACTPLCGFDDDRCAGFCGDRIFAAGEEICEGQIPPGKSCLSYGFDAGLLGCFTYCAPDLADCRQVGELTATSSTAQNLHGVWGSGPADVFAVGSSGTIVHYDGAEWSPMVSGTSEALNAVWGSAGNDVYVVGELGTILHYDGFDWSPMVSGTSQALNGVWGSGAGDVFAVGAGIVLRYGDSSWASVAEPSQTLHGVWGSSPDDVFAVGEDDSVLHYTEGAWETTSTGLGQPLYAIWGSGPGDVFVVSGEGGVARYDGAVWSTLSAGTTSDLRGVWGRGPGDLYVVSDGGAIVHYDGAEWSAMSSTTSAGLNGVWGVGAVDLFAVGWNGTILHQDSAGWEPVTSSAVGSLRAIWASGPADVFAAGSFGALVHDDGTGWSAMLSGTSEHIDDLWGSADDDVFAVAGDGIILHYAGSAWSPMTSGTNAALHGVWGSAPGDVYAVGNLGTILHYDGANWSTMTSATGEALYDVWGSLAGELFAVGWNGTIVHYDGDTWSEMTSGTSEHLRGVWGSGPTDVFAAGSLGTILHYDGLAWSRMDVGTSATLFGVWGSGPADVYAVGDQGLILHYDGLAWSPLASDSPHDLGAIWGRDATDIYAGGAAGTLLRHPRSCLALEHRCDDGNDDDCDSLFDCGDPDCASDLACADGGLCAPATTIACDSSVVGTTSDSDANIDRYACDRWLELGAEKSYRLVADSAGQITVSLTGMGRDLDLIVLREAEGTSACEPRNPGCLGASSTPGDESVTFTAELGAAYYLVVDGYAGNAGSFNLGVSCP